MDEIAIRLRAGGGALLRRSHRDVSGTLDRMLRNGTLVAVLPGVYCAAGDIDDFGVRLRAASLWAGPDAVITGQAAARLIFWPTCPVTHVSLAVPDQGRRSRGRPGSSAAVELECRRVPAWRVRQRGRLRVTSPAMTAVDLAGGPDRGNAVDQVLRTGTATLAEMWDAYAELPGRVGNQRRRQVLQESRDEPWSEAERLQHALLHEAKITGWRANRWVRCGEDGYVVDVLFPAARLVLEVDGWETHGSRAAFEADRRRRNHLVLEGYRVLNFTWRQLVEQPDCVIACIRTALRR